MGCRPEMIVHQGAALPVASFENRVHTAFQRERQLDGVFSEEVRPDRAQYGECKDKRNQGEDPVPNPIGHAASLEGQIPHGECRSHDCGECSEADGASQVETKARIDQSMMLL